MRLLSYSKKFLTKYNYWLFSIAFIIALFSLLYWFDSYFVIKKIEVTGIKRESDITGLYLWNDKNILLLSTKEIETTLVDRNPSIKSVVVTKKLPDTLRYVVEVHKPFAYFTVDHGYFVLSEDGRILSKIKKIERELPVISYYQKLNYTAWQSGDHLTYKDIHTALYFLRQSTDIGLQVNTIDISGLNMIALQVQDRRILFTTEKDVETQEYQLKTLIRQFKINGKDFAVLDLRFDKPIIQFSTK